MHERPSAHIDFDEWAELAKRDPDAFEARRIGAIDAFIRQAPEERRRRLRGLQWRVDQVRNTSPNPVAACVRISEMMWESVTGRQGLLEALEPFRGGRRAPPRRPAKVLPFRRSS